MSGCCRQQQLRRELRRAVYYLLSVTDAPQEAELRQALQTVQDEFLPVKENIMTLLEHWEKRGEKRGQYLVKTKTRIRLLSSAFPEFSPADADRVCQAEEAHNFHHLIPRTLHSNKWFKRRYTRQEMQAGLEVCKSCHSAIHNLIPDEKELGRNYPTREKLLSHPQIAKYVLWKQKRSPSC